MPFAAFIDFPVLPESVLLDFLDAEPLHFVKYRFSVLFLQNRHFLYICGK